MKTPNEKPAFLRFAALGAVALAVLGATGACGGSGVARAVPDPLQVVPGIEAGPSSGIWGDGDTGPHGIHLGCVSNRHFNLGIQVRNRASQAVTILRVGGPQPSARVMERVAVQVRRAGVATGSIVVINLRPWDPKPSAAYVLPPHRRAFIQSNFVMHDCRGLPLGGARLNGSLAITYSVDGARGVQRLATPNARIVLTA
jgi:hypothetical protein